MRVKNENLMVIDGSAAPASMAVTINFKPIWLGHIANYNIQVVFSGAPNGEFKLQVSNDEGQPAAQGDAQKYVGVTNWSDYSNSTQAISASGDHSYEVMESGHNWVRLVWTPTSGSGTILSARAYLKGV